MSSRISSGDKCIFPPFSALTRSLKQRAVKVKVNEPTKQSITMEADDSGTADDQLLMLVDDDDDDDDDDGRRSCDDDGSGGDGSKSSVLPTPLYSQNQRVYAKDEATGLLYPAMIRRSMWGPKSESSLPVPSLLEEELTANNDSGEGGDGSSANNDTSCHDQKVEEVVEEEEDDDEDEDAHRTNPKLNCHHYYVHYLGWNVKWDRWVEEVYLYDHSDSTKLLADKIQKEYDKVKPKKKGQKMSVSQVSRWMKKMVGVELEHRRLEREGKLLVEVPGANNNTTDVSSGKDNGVESGGNNDRDGASTRSDETDKQDSGKANVADVEKAEEEEDNKSKEVAKSTIIKEETLQKQAQLRERGLQLKRKRIHADRLHIPFTLKKILVEEWEVISQCGMLYDLPSKVTVRDALNNYLESKLAPMRLKKEMDNSNNTTSTGTSDERKMDDEDGIMQIENESNNDREKEWINMVEGIALLFDQALPIHLLFEEERTQYTSLRRQILAQRRSAASSDQPDVMKDGDANAGANSSDLQTTTGDSGVKNSEATKAHDDMDTNGEATEIKLLPEHMSEMYGCEHLLRLFIRLPAVVAATPSISETDARRIFSKLGDLVRYLQKHQSELFKSSFRKPLQNECRKVKKEKISE